MGLIFDDRGNRLTPTHATKVGVRYRYYISAILNQGHASKAAKVNRVPAVEIEQLIVARVRQQVRAGARERDHMPEKPELNDKDLISTYVARVDVKLNHLAIRLATNSTRSPAKKSRQKIINVNDEHHQLQHNRTGPEIDTSTDILMIPWKKMPAKRPREIIPPALHSSSPTDHRPSGPRPARNSSGRSPRGGIGSRSCPSVRSRMQIKLRPARIARRVRSI